MNGFTSSCLAVLLAGAIAFPALAEDKPPEDKPILGIVSISATETSNARFIRGAELAASKLGWEVSVTDAQGAVDRANLAIQGLVASRAVAIIDMVFPVTSIGAGLAVADAARVPVARTACARSGG